MPKVRTVRKSLKSVSPRVRASGNSSSMTNMPESSSNSPAQEILNLLRKKYKTSKNDKNAVAMKKYMRDQFNYFGLKAPERRAIDREVIGCSPVLGTEEIRHLLHLLWQEREREYQMFGVDYSAKYIKTLIGWDSATCVESLDCIKTIIQTKSWWDTVDLLASKIVGGMVAAYPDDLIPIMDAWIQDEDMWLRRSAILHQLNYNQNTNKERLFRYCLLCCHEKEFFIQKSIGWALRNYFRCNPSAVKQFVNKNKDKLAALSKKEALKHA